MGKRITESELNQEFIDKFPTKMHNIFKDPKYRQDFLDTVYAEYEEKTVYRLIHRENEICDDDFYYDLWEAEIYNRKIRTPYMIGNYAVSVNEDVNHMLMGLKFPNKKRPLLGIGVGTMKSCYGPADNDSGKTHHNWYLFEDAIKEQKNNFSVYVRKDNLNGKNLGD